MWISSLSNIDLLNVYCVDSGMNLLLVMGLWKVKLFISHYQISGTLTIKEKAFCVHDPALAVLVLLSQQR